jgi:hypothetical protein
MMRILASGRDVTWLLLCAALVLQVVLLSLLCALLLVARALALALWRLQALPADRALGAAGHWLS